MGLEKFINQPMHESDLVQEICLEFLYNFDDYRKGGEQVYFMRLKYVDDKISCVTELRVFENLEAESEWYWSHKNRIGRVSIKPVEDGFQMIREGFYIFNNYTITENGIKPGRPIPSSRDLEETEMPDRELLIRGFDEIMGAVSDSNHNRKD